MRSTGVPPDCERLGHPVVPVSRRRQPEGRDGTRAAELPRRHETLQLDVLGPEAQHHADHKHRVAPGRDGDDRLGVLGRERDGLLQEDALARGERALRVLAVERSGQANVDGLDVRIVNRAVEISGHVSADDLGHPCGLLGCA